MAEILANVSRPHKPKVYLSLRNCIHHYDGMNSMVSNKNPEIMFGAFQRHLRQNNGISIFVALLWK